MPLACTIEVNTRRHDKERKIEELPASGLLLAICTSPPKTSGIRTLNRVEAARKVLRFEYVRLANMFPFPTQSSGELKSLGARKDPWMISRDEIQSGISLADGILLAYGTSAPTGPARHHWREQISWLSRTLEPTDIPVWSVSDEPRHPSRWHRHTFREHPGVPFEDALSLVLRERQVSEGDLRAPAERCDNT